MSLLWEWNMRDLFKVRVGAYIFNKEKILLLKNVNGVWSIPGGHLHHDEDIQEALRREILEETGIKVVTLEFFRYSTKQNSCFLLFFATTTEQEIKLSTEHLDYKWTDLGYLEEFAFSFPELKEDAIYLYSERVNK